MNQLADLTGALAVIAFFALMLEQSVFAAHFALPLRIFNLLVLSVFLLDVGLRVARAPNPREHARKYWYDFIVALPLLQFITPPVFGPVHLMVRQAAIITMLITRTKRVKALFSKLNMRPAQLMLVSFFMTICVGAVLLTLPLSTRGPLRTSLLDAFFTATSAVCVTGLVVKDTATHYTLFGQTVILALIQLGGLGIMTFSVFLALMGGRRMGMREQIMMQDVLDQDALSGAGRLIWFIIRMTLAVEAAGALALAVGWMGQGKAVAWWSVPYHAVFHSVSAFCNAGFSTFSDSLMRFSNHTWTNLVICALIATGGIGFAAVLDVAQSSRTRGRLRLRVHTRIVLSVSAMLILMGALGVFAFEPLAGTGGVKHSILIALFQSVSARTAGFNTCDIGRLANGSLFLIMLLMFIGASPGSTGGGIKTTTFAVLWAAMMNGFTQRTSVEVYKRTIPPETIIKAMALLTFTLAILSSAAVALLAVEDKPMRDVLFEAVSALATVGLSTGITPALTPAGKAIITALMFVGRLGPLTVAYALVRQRTHAQYAYAEERVMIG
jgi:trk system potassium uptake protein TrkH